MALATAQFNIANYPLGLDNTQRFLWTFGTVSFIGASPAYQQGGIRVNFSPLEQIKVPPQYLTPLTNGFVVSNSGSGFDYSLNTQGFLITNVALTTNVVTITTHNNLAVGDVVKISGVTTATFLNGLSLTVASSSATQFTANLTHANYGTAGDTGFALPTSYVTGLPFQGLLQIWQTGTAANNPLNELATGALPAGIVGSATVNADVIAFDCGFARAG